MATKTEREREKKRRDEKRREEKRKEGKGRGEKRDEERHHCTQTATFFTLSFVLRVAIALPLRCNCSWKVQAPSRKNFMIQRNRWIRTH